MPIEMMDDKRQEKIIKVLEKELSKLPAYWKKLFGGSSEEWKKQVEFQTGLLNSFVIFPKGNTCVVCKAKINGLPFFRGKFFFLQKKKGGEKTFVLRIGKGTLCKKCEVYRVGIGGDLGRFVLPEGNKKSKK